MKHIRITKHSGNIFIDKLGTKYRICGAPWSMFKLTITYDGERYFIEERNYLLIAGVAIVLGALSFTILECVFNYSLFSLLGMFYMVSVYLFYLYGSNKQKLTKDVTIERIKVVL